MCAWVCSVDWLEAVGIFKDLAIASAAIATATVAWRGLSKWRSETTGKARFESAANLLQETLHLRDALDSARAPWISGSEYSEPDGGKKVDPRSPEVLTHVYRNRWKPVKEVWDAFRKRAVEAEVLLGPNIAERADRINNLVVKIASSINEVIDNAQEGGRNFEGDKEFRDSVMSVVASSRGDMENATTREIYDAVQDLRTQLRKDLS